MRATRQTASGLDAGLEVVAVAVEGLLDDLEDLAILFEDLGDAIDAENELLRSRVDLLNARVDAFVARLAIEHATGRDARNAHRR